MASSYGGRCSQQNRCTLKSARRPRKDKQPVPNEPTPTKVARERSASKRTIASFSNKTGPVATVALESCRTVNIGTGNWYTTICLPEVIDELRKNNRNRRIVLLHGLTTPGAFPYHPSTWAVVVDGDEPSSVDDSRLNRLIDAVSIVWTTVQTQSAATCTKLNYPPHA
ncbi:hypothetical protein EVAR_98478_1 [Eumeta japonica]|uniref:Uncharacterized protein n=1 Tax=Eumeta variegata TaxID=151549 RepID=A0A4C1YE01_EUMVA|nr:hypothetical protein EVAR_98478_1 [Eumeta japonica]